MDTNGKVSDEPSTDIRQVVAQFERLLNCCPPEFGGRQIVTTMRRPKMVLVEIHTSFKLDVPSNGRASIK